MSFILYQCARFVAGKEEQRLPSPFVSWDGALAEARERQEREDPRGVVQWLPVRVPGSQIPMAQTAGWRAPASIGSHG